MEDFLDTMFLLGLVCGFAFLVAQMSKEKDIGFWTLFVTSIFLTPFVGLLLGLIAKRKPKEGSVNISNQEANESQNSFLSRFMSKKDKSQSNQEMDMPDFDNSKK
jgi:hypothetical protein